MNLMNKMDTKVVLFQFQRKEQDLHVLCSCTQNFKKILLDFLRMEGKLSMN